MKTLENDYAATESLQELTEQEMLNTGGGEELTIQGHSHIIIQPIGDQGSPDAEIFAFFKGLNDPAVGQG